MKAMTVNEVAVILGVDGSTVRRHVRKLFPGVAVNGIKQEIQTSGRHDLQHLGNVAQVTTELGFGITPSPSEQRTGIEMRQLESVR